LAKKGILTLSAPLGQVNLYEGVAIDKVYLPVRLTSTYIAGRNTCPLNHMHAWSGYA